MPKLDDRMYALIVTLAAFVSVMILLVTGKVSGEAAAALAGVFMAGMTSWLKPPSVS